VGSARLLIVCPDGPGIVAATSTFLHEHGANILDSAQHSTDPTGGTFFMRMEFQLDGLDDGRKDFELAFEQTVAQRFDMTWRLSSSSERKRVAILVSRYEHCVLDLLWRWRRNEIDAEITHVISNHPDLEADVRSFDLPYTYVPVPRDDKAAAEEQILSLLAGRVDLVILARYMQILSADFLRRIEAPVINIHHSFLPAFVGSDPYRRALERGVKIIGATAHYVTEELDGGPIIEQDIARISHRDNAQDLERISRDIERAVLARAVRWHLEDRVLIDENRTFVFV
jgi:formyltetrahydrofolate deformylase